MGTRIAGIAFLKVNGDQFPLRGNFIVSPSPTERTGIAGQNGVHGFIELPRVPFIEGDISLTADVSMDVVDAVTDATITAELANGHVYVLRNAWTKSAQELNTNDGMSRIRWEGMECIELL